LRWKEVVSEDVDAKHRYQDGDKDDHKIRRKVNQFSEHVFGLNVSDFWIARDVAPEPTRFVRAALPWPPLKVAEKTL
jgi:hypothetical protein